MSEGHSRITVEEIAAWKDGDWGYVSESDVDKYGPASREELIEWCVGILQDPALPVQKLREVYNLLAKDPMGPPQPDLRTLVQNQLKK